MLQSPGAFGAHGRRAAQNIYPFFFCTDIDARWRSVVLDRSRIAAVLVPLDAPCDSLGVSLPAVANELAAKKMIVEKTRSEAFMT